MIVTATADLHGDLPEIAPCDLLIVAGDVVPIYTHSNKMRELDWLRNHFAKWLDNNPAKHTVWIAGNHDFILDKEWDAKLEIENPTVYYLKDDLISIPEDKEWNNAIEVWGTPWTGNLPFWAFQANGEEAYALYDRMPLGVDILVSHGPPKGYGDYVLNSGNNGDKFVGSPELLKVIWEKRPKVVVCGHIHEGYGLYRERKTGIDIYNVSHMNEMYEPVHKPVTFSYRSSDKQINKESKCLT